MGSHIAPEFRIELVCDVEQVGVKRLDVEAQERLMMCDAVAKFVEATDTFVDVLTSGTWREREVERRTPDLDRVILTRFRSLRPVEG